LKTISKKYNWLVVGFIVCLTLACHIHEALEPVTQYASPIDTTANLNPIDSENPCFGTFTLGDDVTIECAGEPPSVVSTFKGSLQYNGVHYVKATRYVVHLYKEKEDTQVFQKCVFEFSHLEPNKTIPISCEVTADYCTTWASGYLADFCELENYAEYLEAVDVDDLSEDTTDEEPVADPLIGFTMDEVREYLLKEWTDRLKMNPCQPDVIQDGYWHWVHDTALAWAGTSDVFGEGKDWITYNEFVDWMIIQVRTDAAESANRTWDGSFEIPVVPGKACLTCAPPLFSGTITLTINLETCVVTGHVYGGGAGYGIKSDCEDDIQNDCDLYASVEIEGDIFGTVNDNGHLLLEPTSILYDYSATFTNCMNHKDGTEEAVVNDELAISGNIFWQGTASGYIDFPESSCIKNGTWNATENSSGQE